MGRSHLRLLIAIARAHTEYFFHIDFTSPGGKRHQGKLQYAASSFAFLSLYLSLCFLPNHFNLYLFDNSIIPTIALFHEECSHLFFLDTFVS